MDHDPSLTGAAADAIETLTADHRQVEQLFRMLEHAMATDNTRVADDVGRRIVRDLSVHAAIEEEILYPVLRDIVGESESLVRQNVNEHAEMKRLLARVDGQPASNSSAFKTFMNVKRIVEDHVEHEESRDFAQLRDDLSEEKLMEIGRLLDAARKLAPTHPHPKVTAASPATIVANAGAALIDRVRDVISPPPGS
jgi:hemerythrin superfamily protein